MHFCTCPTATVVEVTDSNGSQTSGVGHEQEDLLAQSGDGQSVSTVRPDGNLFIDSTGAAYGPSIQWLDRQEHPDGSVS